jgi:hypothetical protein
MKTEPTTEAQRTRRKTNTDIRGIDASTRIESVFSRLIRVYPCSNSYLILYASSVTSVPLWLILFKKAI